MTKAYVQRTSCKGWKRGPVVDRLLHNVSPGGLLYIVRYRPIDGSRVIPYEHVCWRVGLSGVGHPYKLRLERGWAICVMVVTECRAH